LYFKWNFRICKKYQRCSKCVEKDGEGSVTGTGDVCNWESSRYEISYNATLARLDCSVPASDGVCGFSQCKEWLRTEKIF
jgi:hypothetical protein